MKPTLARLAARAVAFAVLLFVLAAPVLATPLAPQSITLQPGWNAVHIEVLPTNPNLAAVFAGLDVDSVWAYGNDLGAPDFISEVTEESLARAGWFSWVPTNRVDAFQNNLYEIQVNRAYLVKMNGAAPATLSLLGRPRTRPRAWLPDSWNFRGFPIDPALPPTFLNFFKYSAAHYALPKGLEAIYRLNSSGQWQAAAPTDLMGQGVAYWVYTRGASAFVAPTVARPLLGDGLQFSTATDQVEFILNNLTASSVNLTVKDLNAPAANPLSFADRASVALSWLAVPSPWVRPVPAATARRERISARRVAMETDRFETVLEVTDGLGTRQLIPVEIDRTPLGPESAPSFDGKSKKNKAFDLLSARAVDHVGLWVGFATISGVSEAHSGPLTTNIESGFTTQLETNESSRLVTTNIVPHSVARVSPSMAPTPTAAEFNLRVLLHVDTNGQTRLLKEVIEMWKNGVSTNDADGNNTLVTPGHFVLVTDDTKVGQFVGVSGRDGTPTGRRLSVAGFDFAENELPMDGDFAIGSAVEGTISMSETFTRNPFKHRYHPDHQQGYKVTRVISFEFSAAPTNAPPGYDERVLDGIYRETITGLHRTNIVVSGTFRLNRIATVGVLNQ